MSIWNLFGKKNIYDNIKDFESEYKAVQIISVQYLTLRLKQIFETPEYQKVFADEVKLPEALAIEIVKYLSAQDPEETVDHGNDKEVFAMAKTHAVKWADDIMNQDPNFCELRVQTLRLDLIYNNHQRQQDNSYKSPRDKRVLALLNKYGPLVPEEPDPNKYSKLVSKWIAWSEAEMKNE